MSLRSLTVATFLVALSVAGCGDDPAQTPVTPELAKVKPPDVCQSGAASKAAGGYFLDNGQRRRVKARVADLAGYCDDWIDGDPLAEGMAKDAARKLAFEVELALDPSNPQAGPAAEGSKFLNDVLRLAGINCALGTPCNDPLAVGNYQSDVLFGGSLSSGAAGAFALRPVPVGPNPETLPVVSRHSLGDSRWAVEPIVRPGPGGVGVTSGEWSGTLAAGWSILFGEPGDGSDSEYDWFVFPDEDFAEEVLVVYCGYDNGVSDVPGSTTGILTREAKGLQRGSLDPGFDPAYCTDDDYFANAYAPYLTPIETAARMEYGRPGLLGFAGSGLASLTDWIGDRVEGLIQPRALSAAFAVNPGPRGTGLSSGFSTFDQVVVLNSTAQLEFVNQPCDTQVEVVLSDCSGAPIQVRAFILDENGVEVPFERLQIGMVATNNNGLYGVLDGGNVNLCQDEPQPYMPGDDTVPCAATTELSGEAVFLNLQIVSTSSNPNAANGGYELLATAVGPPGTFGYTVAPATSVKFNINPN
jgi:hypothetical protein